MLFVNTTPIKSYLCEAYEAHSKNNKYIIGYPYKGVIYATVIDSNMDLLARFLIVDKDGRNTGYKLRLWISTNEQKEALMNTYETFVLCSQKFFEDGCSKTLNRGERFEKLVIEHFGGTWQKDHIPFYEDADLTIGINKYQIKYHKGTFCTEKQILGLR